MMLNKGEVRLDQKPEILRTLGSLLPPPCHRCDDRPVSVTAPQSCSRAQGAHSWSAQAPRQLGSKGVCPAPPSGQQMVLRVAASPGGEEAKTLPSESQPAPSCSLPWRQKYSSDSLISHSHAVCPTGCQAPSFYSILKTCLPQKVAVVMKMILISQSKETASERLGICPKSDTR